MTTTIFKSELSFFTPEQRAEWWCEFTSHRWPLDFPSRDFCQRYWQQAIEEITPRDELLAAWNARHGR
jgi:uncharacterized protein YndB with AHSA1/START domain